MAKVNPDTVLLVEKVLPKVIDSYNKSLNRNIDSDDRVYNYSISIPDNDSFHIQELVFVEVALDCKRRLSLVMKAMQLGQEYFANHYENEIRMYKEIIPLLGLTTKQMFPRCIYARAPGSSESALLVLQNLLQAGYKMSKNRIILSQEEIRLALKTLAEFHGHCYALKLKSRKTFDEIVAKIQPTYFVDEKSAHPMYKASQSLAAVRVLKRFLHRFDKCKRMETLTRKARGLLNRITQGNHLAFIKKFMQPLEPLAILCHGDYNRNNIMFKYADSNEERPTDCIIIDLQTICYSSPMSDLSFLLFMNMRADENRPWDQLWDVYHNTLVTILCKKTGMQRAELPDYFSLSMFKEELRKYCLCSYMIAVSFLNITGQGAEVMMQRMGAEYEEQKRLYLAEEKGDETLREHFDVYFYNKVTDEFDTDEIRDISDDLTMEVLNLYDETVLTY